MTDSDDEFFFNNVIMYSSSSESDSEDESDILVATLVCENVEPQPGVATFEEFIDFQFSSNPPIYLVRISSSRLAAAVRCRHSFRCGRLAVARPAVAVLLSCVSLWLPPSSVPVSSTFLRGRVVVGSEWLSLVMACPFCRAAGGPCSSFDSCASVFTVVLDRSCSRRVYIPCSVRSHLARYIEECRALAIRRGDTAVDLALHNSEGNLYHVLFRHGRTSSKFHGSSWEELVNDYGLRHHDIMTVRLELYETMISVDFHRDGVMLFPLPSVALEDLSETRRELVDSCFYSRGVTLNYHQMITSMNVNDQHMMSLFLVTVYLFVIYVIPSLVVSSLKDFLSIPRTGSLTLEIGLDSEDDDIYVSIPCSYFVGLYGRMVFKKEGFSNFLRASSIEVNNLVLITFKERDQELVVIFNLLPQ
ncbi:Receptor-like protein kinase HERK 1 [Hordeum vulgare]|nr:Receptor-like protein kinase HERK 1 [Hordeum vulgare]